MKVISYHDVRDDVSGSVDPDRFAISTEHLIAHFEWLRAEGYTPVSVERLQAAVDGSGDLPEKPVLLTFDDGLRSVYTRVFPLLKLYEYPAVVAVVGSWLDAPDGWTLEYDGKGTLDADDFVTWEQLREMEGSGLVEVATHSHDLHRGVLGNPFGNEQPAAVTRVFDPVSGAYESESEYRRRIETDLSTAASRISEELGRPPRIVVWPYGEYSPVTEAIAAELGMTVSLGLASGDHVLDDLSGVRRYLLTGNPSVEELAFFLRRSMDATSPVRVVHVDLDYVYDDDPVQMERNLDVLLDRIQAIGPSHVYLQAFADPTGDGTATSLYFPNRHLPMRADLFNRVAWQLRTRVGVRVFAWMPMLAFDLGDQALNDALSVKRWEGDRAVPSRPDYRRLSPWEPEARRIIRELFEDLAVHAAFDGILFHDDAYLNDREDASAYPDDPGRLPSARERTTALLDFGDELAGVVRSWRPSMLTARNLYARVVLEPESEAWFAQSFTRSLEHYDHTAVMAMPYMEGASDPVAWLDRLLERVAAVSGGLEGTVFEVQSVDWRTGTPVPAAEMAEWMRRLESQGGLHFGYYPDDFIRGLPELGPIREALSVETDPWRAP
ncbi:MAG: poly-beta-1,6-N-acetyl-D-glucosamine N-deacetylase PgaB [Gemmatimonadota bacterium]|nr:poly-beta-1,6-N-acetyl-D-glucosamine N-deacetylase PgaB [Gemmatimonadota bacterium]